VSAPPPRAVDPKRSSTPAALGSGVAVDVGVATAGTVGVTVAAVGVAADPADDVSLSPHPGPIAAKHIITPTPTLLRLHPLGVGVGGAPPVGHPLSARLTASSSSATVTAPSPLVSASTQAARCAEPSARLTPMTSSFTVTAPS